MGEKAVGARLEGAGATPARRASATRRARVAPELVLVALSILALAVLPIELGELYGGLPAHPLVVHLAVVAIPLAALAAIALMARPSWMERWGVAAGVLALAALVGTFLAAGTGEALRESLGAGGNSHLVAEHAEAADTLRVLVFGLVVAFTVTLAAEAARRGRIALPGMLGGLVERGWVMLALRAIVVVLAVLSLVFVVRVGDLGAKSVWQDESSLVQPSATPGAVPGPPSAGV